MTSLLLCLLLAFRSFAFVAYNCNSRYQDVIKYDAANPSGCDLEQDWMEEQKDTRIQVFQVNSNQLFNMIIII